MAAKNFLAFDLGAESGRAILGTLSEGRLNLAEKHRFPNPTGRLNGHLHWNLLQQWEELKTGLRKAGTDGQRRLRLSGIGIDTWGVDFGLIGASGEVLGFPYHYRDSRTDGMLENAFAKVGKDRIFQATGIQFMQLNTLYQLLAMRQSRSPLLDVAQTLLFMPDLLNYLFTGQRKSEYSIASTSQMYDPRKRDWATDLLKALDLPTHFLPQVVHSGTILGPVLPDVAAECGVESVPLIAPGCHDTASAVAAVPAQGEDWCYISSGTWSLMGVERSEPIINDKTLGYNYTNEGGVDGGIRFLKNIMGLWLVQECRRQWMKEGHEHSYGALTQMASRGAEFAALVDPNHGAFLTPGEMPQKIEQFCDQTRQKAPRDRAEYVRVCLEGLALAYRRALEGLEDILGRKIRTIHIVGGGSRNELLNQMTADACGRTVLAGPEETTAIGNILVQCMAVGEIKSLPDARAIVRDSFEVKHYEPADTQKWDRAYERFREISARQ